MLFQLSFCNIINFRFFFKSIYDWDKVNHLRRGFKSTKTKKYIYIHDKYILIIRIPIIGYYKGNGICTHYVFRDKVRAQLYILAWTKSWWELQVSFGSIPLLLFLDGVIRSVIGHWYDLQHNFHQFSRDKFIWLFHLVSFELISFYVFQYLSIFNFQLCSMIRLDRSSQ